MRLLVALPPLSYRLMGILVATALDQGLAALAPPARAPSLHTWVIGDDGGGGGGGGGVPPSLAPSAIPADRQILGLSSLSASPRPRAVGSAGGTTPSSDTITGASTTTNQNSHQQQQHHQQHYQQQQQQKLVLPHFDPHALY